MRLSMYMCQMGLAWRGLSVSQTTKSGCQHWYQQHKSREPLCFLACKVQDASEVHSTSTSVRHPSKQQASLEATGVDVWPAKYEAREHSADLLSLEEHIAGSRQSILLLSQSSKGKPAILG